MQIVVSRHKRETPITHLSDDAQDAGELGRVVEKANGVRQRKIVELPVLELTGRSTDWIVDTGALGMHLDDRKLVRVPLLDLLELRVHILDTGGVAQSHHTTPSIAH